MRIIAKKDKYDTNRVFQLDLSVEDFSLINYAIAYLSEAEWLSGKETSKRAKKFSLKLEELREKFVIGAFDDNGVS